MAQTSNGSITITDLTDITDVYLEYCMAADSITTAEDIIAKTIWTPPERGWSTEYPTWQSGYQIWIREVTKKEGITQLEHGTPYLDKAVNQINNNISNIQTKIKKIWSNSTGSYMASGIGGNDVIEDNVNTYGFNSKFTTTGISFNYNAIPLTSLGTDGLKLYDSNNIPIAQFSDTGITMGKSDGSQSYLFEDYHSFKMYDKAIAEILNCEEFDGRLTYEVGDVVYLDHQLPGERMYYVCKTQITTPGPWDSSYWTKIFPSAFFHVSDLKDKNGVATITETIKVNNSESYIDVKRSIYNGSYSLSVNGDEATVTQWPYSDQNNRIKVLQPKLQEGDIVVVSYSAKEDDENMFAFTFGRRAAEAPVGPMSIGMGNFIISSGTGSWAEGWRTIARGDYSHAEGYSTTASGDVSHTEGMETTASSSYSHAEGWGTTASGWTSHAEGRSTNATGDYSHSEGRSTNATGPNSHAEGSGTQAISNGAHAEGFGTIASGYDSHAEGDDTTASGDYSHSEGSNTTASGSYSHAEGAYTTASGYISHAEGNSTIASGIDSHAQNRCTVATETCQTVIGKYNAATVSGSGTATDPYTYADVGDYAFIIGNGTANTTANRSNALTVDWQGRIACSNHSGILQSIFNIFYPVGSYYETSLPNAIPSGESTPTDTDLASLGTTWFNPKYAWGGEWILELEGQVHVSAGSNYTVSGALSNTSDGGSKDAIVPTHNHDIKAKTTGVPSNNTSGGQSQGHTHSPSNGTHFMYYDSDVSGANVGRRNIGSGSGSYYTWTAAKTDALKASTATSGASQGHTHSLQNHTHTLAAHSTEGAGEDSRNKNMQPYIVVYRWHRTA